MHGEYQNNDLRRHPSHWGRIVKTLSVPYLRGCSFLSWSVTGALVSALEYSLLGRLRADSANTAYNPPRVYHRIRQDTRDVL
jgi:hypothetical protein